MADLVLCQFATSRIVRAKLVRRRADGFVIVNFAGTGERVARELTVADVLEIEKGEPDAGSPTFKA